MRDESLNYIITAFLPEKTQDKINMLRKKLHVPRVLEEDGVRIISTTNHPHITMKRAFYVAENSTETAMLEKVSALSFQKVTVVIERLEIFTTPTLGRVLVGMVSEEKKLQAVHSSIYDHLEGMIEDKYTKYQKEHFSPHVSFIYNLDSSREEEALQLFQELLPLTISIDTLHVLKSNPDIAQTRLLLKKLYATE